MPTVIGPQHPGRHARYPEESVLPPPSSSCGSQTDTSTNARGAMQGVARVRPALRRRSARRSSCPGTKLILSLRLPLRGHEYALCEHLHLIRMRTGAIAVACFSRAGISVRWQSGSDQQGEGPLGDQNTELSQSLHSKCIFPFNLDSFLAVTGFSWEATWAEKQGLNQGLCMGPLLGRLPRSAPQPQGYMPPLSTREYPRVSGNSCFKPTRVRSSRRVGGTAILVLPNCLKRFWVKGSTSMDKHCTCTSPSPPMHKH